MGVRGWGVALRYRTRDSGDLLPDEDVGLFGVRAIRHSRAWSECVPARETSTVPTLQSVCKS